MTCHVYNTHYNDRIRFRGNETIHLVDDFHDL